MPKTTQTTAYFSNSLTTGPASKAIRDTVPRRTFVATNDTRTQPSPSKQHNKADSRSFTERTLSYPPLRHVLEISYPVYFGRSEYIHFKRKIWGVQNDVTNQATLESASLATNHTELNHCMYMLVLVAAMFIWGRCLFEGSVYSTKYGTYKPCNKQNRQANEWCKQK